LTREPSVTIEKKYPAELRAKIIAAYQAGKTSTEVGRQFKVPTHTVLVLARKAGLVRLRGGYAHRVKAKSRPRGVGRIYRQQRSPFWWIRFSVRGKRHDESSGIHATQKDPPPQVEHLLRQRIWEEKQRSVKPAKHKSLNHAHIYNEVIEQIDAALAEIIAARIIKALEAIRDH
jgi:transposase-like protein